MRPLVAEVQALVAKSHLPAPRRATSGLDTSRVSMVLAVLAQRCKISMHEQDVYVSTVGGVRLSETSVDLALALAVAGSTVEQSLSSSLIALGEVGLAGEVRVVPGSSGGWPRPPGSASSTRSSRAVRWNSPTAPRSSGPIPSSRVTRG